MIVILLIIGVATLLCLVAFKNHNYWNKKNVQTGKVPPIIGDGLWMFLGRENLVSLVQRTYYRLQNVRYIGMYQFGTPTLLLKSPELIKQICVKNFDHFADHQNIIPDRVDEFWSSNLFFLKGQTWKHMRSTLSPTFTTSKIKSMFVLMCENAEIFVKYFLDKNEEIVEIEAKDALTRYANDIIANVAFGVQINSLNDRENEFITMGREATTFNTISTGLTIFLHNFLPSIGAFFEFKFISKKVRNFYINLVKDQVLIREERNIKRADILGLLLETRKGKQETEEEIKDVSFAAVDEHLEMKNTKENLSDFDITAQLFVFFFGGFESTSMTMCLLAQELVENPDIQKRLIEEIDENRPDSGVPTYDIIVKMTYFDMVISEILRKWPINLQTDRVCTKPYTILPENPEEHPVNLDVKDTILVPIYGIHHDPQYYPEPEKFDPERFSPENRKTIDPYTYLPFGVGPRNCIGSRFALLEIKALFFYILSNFEIVPVETTQIPMRLKKNSLGYAAEKGFNLGLKRRY